MPGRLVKRVVKASLVLAAVTLGVYLVLVPLPRRKLLVVYADINNHLPDVTLLQQKPADTYADVGSIPYNEEKSSPPSNLYLSILQENARHISESKVELDDGDLLTKGLGRSAPSVSTLHQRRYGDACNYGHLPDSAVQTCRERTLKQGYVLLLDNWEQQTAGSANFMSVQCWAETMNMVVVEPLTDKNSWHVPLPMRYQANATTEVKGVTLSDIFDFDQWNQYAIGKCYAPIVKWKDFLCHAPRQAILVHITYSSYNNPGEVTSCSPKEMNDFKAAHSRFFVTHGFQIVRQVCVNQRTQHLTTKTFNEYILGNYSSSQVTVIIDRWRGAESGGAGRTGISGTRCGRGAYLSLPFAKPSARMLAEIKLLQEKLMNNEPYIAVMVRNEPAVKKLAARHDPSSWSYDACLEGVMSAWRELRAKHPELKKTFWSFDASKYGTTELNKRAREQYNAFMIRNHNMSYSQFEDMLVEMGGLPNGAYIAALEQHFSARARCLLLIGGGTFQAHASSVYSSHHSGSSSCLQQFGASWLVEKCSIKK